MPSRDHWISVITATFWTWHTHQCSAFPHYRSPKNRTSHFRTKRTTPIPSLHRPAFVCSQRPSCPLSGHWRVVGSRSLRLSSWLSLNRGRLPVFFRRWRWCRFCYCLFHTVCIPTSRFSLNRCKTKSRSCGRVSSPRAALRSWWWTCQGCHLSLRSIHLSPGAAILEMNGWGDQLCRKWDDHEDIS